MTPRALWDRWAGPLHLTLMGGIVLGAFGVRVQNIDAAAYGDEAYYYFISHGLSHYFDTAHYPEAGSAFPLMPVLYRPFTHSLQSARAVNAITGAIAVLLVMLVLHQLRVSRPLQLAAGLLVALNPIEVEFSAWLFEDMIGATLALGALLAYVRGRLGIAAGLTALAVLSKQYYAFFGVALFIDQLVTNRRLYRAMFIAGGVVAAWVVLRYFILKAPLQFLLQEHAIQPLTLDDLRRALGGWLIVPLVIAGAVLGSRLRAAAYMLVLFLGFLALWRNAQSWYMCLPIALSATLAAYGAEMAWRRVQPRLAAGAVAATAVALVALTVGFSALDTWNFVREAHDHDLVRATAYVEGLPPLTKPLGLVGCFWAVYYYPFLNDGVPVRRTVDTWSEVSGDTALVCEGAPPPPPEWQVAYRAGRFQVATRGAQP